MPSVTKFVGEKVTAVRWRPTPDGSAESPVCFAMGTCEAMPSTVSLWNSAAAAVSETSSAGLHSTTEPRCVWKSHYDGDVMALQYVDCETFVTASSTGSVHLWSHADENDEQDAFYVPGSAHVSVAQQWTDLHSVGGLSSPCTALSVYNRHDVATVGEDGRLTVLRPSVQRPVFSVANADSSSLSAVAFLRSDQVLTASTSARIKVWDVRTNSGKGTEDASVRSTPALSISDDSDARSETVNCAAVHPAQPHVVALGLSSGVLAVWDLRAPRWPVSEIAAHTNDIWDISFNQANPRFVVSASEDGSALVWDFNSTGSHPGGCYTVASDDNPSIRSLLTAPSEKTLPVNSIDVSDDNKVVCGLDSGAVCLVSVQ